MIARPKLSHVERQTIEIPQFSKKLGLSHPRAAQAKVGLDVAPDCKPYAVTMLHDYLFCFKEVRREPFASELLKVGVRAGTGCEVGPTSNRSSLGRFPLVSADSSTSDRLSERSRSVGVLFLERARAEHPR